MAKKGINFTKILGITKTSLFDSTGTNEVGITNNRLDVNATVNVGDIQIGAVEIKDRDSNTRLDVELDSSKNALYVQSESLANQIKQDSMITELQNIFTDTSKIAGTVIGNELQVDIVSPLPAGTNNIGDVDVLTLPDVDINDISKGTQTNDVKVTMDGEEIVVAPSTNIIGKVIITDGVDDAEVVTRLDNVKALAVDAVLVIGEQEIENFKKPSYATELKNLQKGGINKIIIKPRVLLENMNLDTNNVSEVGVGSVTDVGQVFRLTGGINNIDRVQVTLEAEAGAGLIAIEDFESYADTTALRAIWVPNDTTNTPNELETSIVAEGSKAMKVAPSSNQKSKNDTITKTYGTPQDWSSSDGIQFSFRKDGTYTVELQIIDSSGNGSKQSITVSNTGVYEFLTLNFTGFIPVGAIAVDLTDIEKIIFKNVQGGTDPYYVDGIELFSSAAFGTADLEIYDFGTTSNPITLGSPVATVEFDLQSGKRTYDIEVDITGLTPNNYFGINVTNASTSTIKVFGKNGSNQYQNGFSYDSTDDGTNIASTGSGDDLYFLVFALDKCIFNGIRLVVNAEDTGDGKFDLFINDNASGKGKTSLFIGERLMDRKVTDFPIRTQTNVGVRMTQDEILFLSYTDDGGSLVTLLQATAYLVFVDRELNG